MFTDSQNSSSWLCSNKYTELSDQIYCSRCFFVLRHPGYRCLLGGEIVLIIFHPYVINRDLPLNTRCAGPLNTHLLFESAQTQMSSFRIACGWLHFELSWEYESMKLHKASLTALKVFVISNWMYGLFFFKDSAHIQECFVQRGSHNCGCLLCKLQVRWRELPLSRFPLHVLFLCRLSGECIYQLWVD